MYSSNGLPKLNFVESAVFGMVGGGGGGVSSIPSPPFVEGVGTKYLRTGRVNPLKLPKILDIYSGMALKTTMLI